MCRCTVAPRRHRQKGHYNPEFAWVLHSKRYVCTHTAPPFTCVCNAFQLHYSPFDCLKGCSKNLVPLKQDQTDPKSKPCLLKLTLLAFRAVNSWWNAKGYYIQPFLSWWGRGSGYINTYIWKNGYSPGPKGGFRLQRRWVQKRQRDSFGLPGRRCVLNCILDWGMGELYCSVWGQEEGSCYALGKILLDSRERVLCRVAEWELTREGLSKVSGRAVNLE